MARYFFHIRDRIGVIPDREGEEFPTLDEAKAKARTIARELIAESSKMGTPALNRVFEAMNVEGKILFTLRFSDVVAVNPDGNPSGNPAGDPASRAQNRTET